MMGAVRAMAAKGTAVIYVSHRLEEIVFLCEHVTVLRNGEIAARLNGKESSVNRLSKLMTGEKVDMTIRRPEKKAETPAIQLKAFKVEKPGDGLEGLDLTIFKGEIFGVTSLSGHGRTALGPGIMGFYPTKGEVSLNGRPMRSRNPLGMIRESLWMVSEERRTDGLLLDHTIMENITFPANQAHGEFLRKTWIPFLSFPDKKRSQLHTRDCIKALDIRCRSPFQKAGELSGGNQQKICIAGALSVNPKILIVNDPTRGIDIAAKESILKLLVQAHQRNGMTLVVISGELGELKRICDRIAVIYKGKLFGVFSPDRDENDLVLACSGIGRKSDPC
jgi:simple sugar transport system ATP-binding protein